MATQANLIATYQSNPTLQNRYTQQEYLDMFGFGTQTPTPDPDPDPTPDPGIPNIINQNLNQGGDGGGQIPTNPSRFATLEKTYNPNKELSVGEYFSGVEGSPIYTSTYNKPPSFMEGILSIPGKVIEAYTDISPVFSYLKNKQAEKEKTQQSIMQRNQLARQKEREALAIIEAEKAREAAALANATRTGRAPTAPRGSGIQDSQSLGNPSAGQTGGYSYDSGGRQGFGYGLADGGRVYLYNRLK